MGKQSHASKWDDLFREEFEKETDRASVILACAMIESTLETMIKSKLVPSPTAEDNLFDTPYAPVSNFRAKIELAYRIGLISSNLCHDLNIIRHIRNDFAHNIKGCSFEDPVVRNRITELMRSSDIAAKAPKVRAKAFPTGSRGDFQITISWILWSLNTEIENIKPIKAQTIEFGYIENLKE